MSKKWMYGLLSLGVIASGGILAEAGSYLSMTVPFTLGTISPIPKTSPEEVPPGLPQLDGDGGNELETKTSLSEKETAEQSKEMEWDETNQSTQPETAATAEIDQYPADDPAADTGSSTDPVLVEPAALSGESGPHHQHGPGDAGQ